MLTFTHEAAEAIDAVVHSTPDAPDGAGLRIARGVAPDGQEGLELSVTDGPAPDDAVVEAEGTPVFLRVRGRRDARRQGPRRPRRRPAGRLHAARAGRRADRLVAENDAVLLLPRPRSVRVLLRPLS